jgi:hypothetical protein
LSIVAVIPRHRVVIVDHLVSKKVISKKVIKLSFHHRHCSSGKKLKSMTEVIIVDHLVSKKVIKLSFRHRHCSSGKKLKPMTEYLLMVKDYIYIHPCRRLRGW